MHTNSISLFLAGCGTKSLVRIEDRLDQLAHEIQSGSRESTIFILDGSDIPADVHWELLGHELHCKGITKEEVDHHKNGIQAYAQELAERYGLGAPASPSCRSCIPLLEMLGNL